MRPAMTWDSSVYFQDQNDRRLTTAKMNSVARSARAVKRGMKCILTVESGMDVLRLLNMK
jgi:hypothetical protein